MNTLSSADRHRQIYGCKQPKKLQGMLGGGGKEVGGWRIGFDSDGDGKRLMTTPLAFPPSAAAASSARRAAPSVARGTLAPASGRSRLPPPGPSIVPRRSSAARATPAWLQTPPPRSEAAGGAAARAWMGLFRALARRGHYTPPGGACGKLCRRQKCFSLLVGAHFISPPLKFFVLFLLWRSRGCMTLVCCRCVAITCCAEQRTVTCARVCVCACVILRCV
jgi:hypothetical protein